MFKKIAALVLCGAMLCGLTGCAFGRKERTIDPKRSPSRYSEQVLQDIQDYLKEGDADALCAMFADYYDVTIQDVRGLFDFINGEIVELDSGGVHSNGGKKRDGEYTYYAYGGRFTISTDNGTEYQGYFAGYAVYDDKPDKVGLEDIFIENIEDTSQSYGLGSYGRGSYNQS